MFIPLDGDRACLRRYRTILNWLLNIIEAVEMSDPCFEDVVNSGVSKRPRRCKPQPASVGVRRSRVKAHSIYPIEGSHVAWE